MTQPLPQRTLRLEPSDVDQLMHELGRDARIVASSRRQSVRLPYRRGDCEVLLWQHSTAGEARHFRTGTHGEVDVWRSAASGGRPFVMESRNLSIQGISLLHGVFVHPGTRCRVTLTDRKGERRPVDGVVVACRYLRGGVHELGVRFDAIIRLREYCPEADAMSRDFLAELQARAEGLALEVEAGNIAALRVLGEAVRTRALGYGYQAIAEGAESLLKVIQASSENLEPVERECKALVDRCRWTDPS
ncbi:MAG: PilZ domain-containing protein [Phycisphaeraceae bacterium]|nr:PilZ domain-containing protein [Phycisphaerales bacterium]QOJ17943.1 MAG: PilZ domain-containing protein [Phycisphaeraceae bacterium]